MKYLLVVSCLLFIFFSSCTKDGPESQVNQTEVKIIDKGTYVTSDFKTGIYYWSNGKSNLLVPGEYHCNPKLSPDGKWILFAWYYLGEYRIKVIKTNGDSLHSVFANRTFKFVDEPMWSKDGSKIMIADTTKIFVTGFPSDLVESYSVSSQRIASHAAAWNSTGDKIFFTSFYKTLPQDCSGIYSIDLNTKQVDTVLKTGIVDVRYLSCSSDDRNLAFSAYTTEAGHIDWNIHILNLQDKKISLASFGDGEDLYPQWSPVDPNLLAYSGGEDKTAFPRVLVIYNNITKIRKAVTSGIHSPSDYPVWSKDGKKILFNRYSYNESYCADLLSGTITQLNIPCSSIVW